MKKEPLNNKELPPLYVVFESRVGSIYSPPLFERRWAVLDIPAVKTREDIFKIAARIKSDLFPAHEAAINIINFFRLED